MNLFNEFEQLSKLLEKLIPVGTDRIYEVDNYRVSINNKEGDINVKIETIEDEFDDSETKELVSNFKEWIQRIDDDIFIESFEQAKEAIDVKTLDDLLNQGTFTEEEAEQVEDMIDYFESIITNNIDNRIKELEDMKLDRQ